jgi:hypothetical protein
MACIMRGARHLWCDKQVHVIGHQHIGVHGAVMLQCGFAQFLAVVQVVGVIGKAGLAVITALDNMLRDAG